jgi:hypothetical protein
MNDLPQTQNEGFCGEFAAPQRLRGAIARWNKEHGWHDSDGVALPSPMLVIGTDTMLVRWHPQRDEIRAKPLPDAELLNSAIPRSEWRDGLNGFPEPPWKKNFEIRMIDPVGGKLYTYANSTYGALICFEQLNEAVFITRQLRGHAVLPLVKLEKRLMSTKQGAQSRPHLEVIEYREPPQSSGAIPPPSPQLPPAASTPTTPTTAPTERSTLDAMKSVKPIPIEEALNDSLPPWA